MAKTVEDLKKSREGKQKILAELGQVPQSIMKYDKSEKAIDLQVEQKRSYENTSDRGGHRGKLGDTFSVSSRTCRGKGAGLSRFPQNIGRLLTLFYTNKGDRVVDPFAGHNSRMELTWRSGRHYYGSDLSKEFMQMNRKVRKMLLAESGFFKNECVIKLKTGDSRHLPWEDNFGHFTITSPPYWDLEYYGDEDGQLGKLTYPEFMDGIEEVMAENFRCLKKGAFCIWCVNDFRTKGSWYNYHGHCIDRMVKVGFVQKDLVITDLGSSIAAAFVNQIVERKRIPKRHEYCLIFQKPLPVVQKKKKKRKNK